MTIRLLSCLAVLSAFSLGASNIVSTGKLAGTVLTHSTNNPIQNATVVLHWNRPGEGHVPSGHRAKTPGYAQDQHPLV